MKEKAGEHSERSPKRLSIQYTWKKAVWWDARWQLSSVQTKAHICASWIQARRLVRNGFSQDIAPVGLKQYSVQRHESVWE